MKVNDEVLKLRTTRLILKHDLGYSMSEEENEWIAMMTEEEIRMIRGNLLKNIRNQILCIDVFEEYLNQLKDEEFQKYMASEGASCDLSCQLEKCAELEGKCNRMIINIAQGMANVESLLGPSIHETYGIPAKKS